MWQPVSGARIGFSFSYCIPYGKLRFNLADVQGNINGVCGKVKFHFYLELMRLLFVLLNEERMEK